MIQSGMAASQGTELNVFMLVCIYNFPQSVRLLTDSLNSFNEWCAAVSVQPGKRRGDEKLHRSPDARYPLKSILDMKMQLKQLCAFLNSSISNSFCNYIGNAFI